MSENLTPIIDGSPRVQAISEALHQTPGYEFTHLKKGESRDFVLDAPMVDEVSINFAADIEQDLYGMIEVGNEHFGVIRVVSSKPAEKHFALTHISHNARHRADLIGEITADPLTVGRKYHKLGNALEHRQFTIVLTGNDTIRLHDLDSLLGTSFVRMAKTQTDAKLAVSSLSEYRQHKHVQHTMSLPNPILHNRELWSAESAIVRSVINDPAVKLPIWHEVPSEDDLIAHVKAEVRAPLPRPTNPHTEEVILLDERRHTSRQPLKH